MSLYSEGKLEDMEKKHVVKLTPQERKRLLAIVRKGKNKAAVIQRAHILLKSDEGQTDRAISEMLYISEQTVRRTRVRYATASLKEALEDKPHPARKPEMDDTQTAYLVALACSDPPAGQAKWTMELLAAQLVEGGIVEHISPETVRLVLKKNKLKPWQVKSWCIPTITPEFLRRMENILALYAQPYNPQRPLVCFDEKSYQLLAHSQPPVTAQVGQARRQDYEYRRQGTRNLFLFVEPKAGQRHVLVTRRRQKQDFAYAMRYLVDELYPAAECIDVVLDNLNTHHYHALVETFGKGEADRMMRRLCFHFTPVHASWLNMAEIELSVLAQQCLCRRLPDEWTLATEIIAWETRRNAARSRIHWAFSLDDARHVFKEHYPTR